MTALQDGDVAQQDIAAILEGERLVALAFLGAFGGIAQPRLVRIHAARLRRYPALDAVPLRPRARAAQAQPVNHAGAEHRDVADPVAIDQAVRSEEHTSELQSLISISSAVFCLKKKKNKQ